MRPESVYSLESLDNEDAPFLEDTPFLEPEREGDRGARSDKYAIPCLLLQHACSTFTDGCYGFAAFLFLIQVFPDSLVPASLVGLGSTLAGLLFSGYVGGLVDASHRLSFVRAAIATQKTLQAGNYALFLLLFGPLAETAREVFTSTGLATVGVWAILLLTVLASSVLQLANTGLTVAVERDWVCAIAEGDAHLTVLNTYMRRIDLMSKLVSPLFVSLLTTFRGYTSATGVLLSLSVVTAVAELLWVRVVYAHFPTLADRYPCVREDIGWGEWWGREVADWREFSRLPVFGSSVAMATIYLTTLSYDGTFIAYVKAARGWDDGFVALMRGTCVLTGLLGTLAMPVLERLVGLERAGAWSLWFEVACLLPSLLSFFVGTGAYGEHGPAWNSVFLFGGIALSRIGLWSFDLCQLKVLQVATQEHPRRNRLTALQMALQDLFLLAKWVVTLIAASPAQFKWTALVSWLAIVVGGLAYAVFLRAVRGHLVHLDWCKVK